MIIKFCNVKVVIIILNMIHLSSSLGDEKKLMLPLKPANCFIPEYCQFCKYYHLPPNHELVAWYFDEAWKACFPYYIDRNGKNCCNGFANRPQTQKECEDMCGEPCIVTHNNYMTEPGICQLYCHIDVPLGIPAPCKLINGWYGVGCCPRGYRYPSFIMKEIEPINYDPPDKVIARKGYTEKIILQQGNKSMLNDDVTADWIVL